MTPSDTEEMLGKVLSSKLSGFVTMLIENVEGGVAAEPPIG